MAARRRRDRRHASRLVLVGPQGHAFEVRRGRYLVGRLVVRNGGLVWWPSRAKEYSYRISWPRLDDATAARDPYWSRRKGRWDPRKILRHGR